MLKFRVFAHAVNNLSDARYFAGMGVEYMGFCCNPKHDRYVPLHSIQNMVGWLSGVSVVAECVGMTVTDSLDVAQNLNAHYILTDMINGDWPEGTRRIYYIDFDNPIRVYPAQGATVWVSTAKKNFLDYHQMLKEMHQEYNYQIIFGSCVNSHNIEMYFSTYHAHAVALKGEDESAPGLKSFEKLAEILEKIEY